MFQPYQGQKEGEGRMTKFTIRNLLFYDAHANFVTFSFYP